MIPAIIHQTAKTKNLTWEERRITRRLLRMLPGWTYHLWDDADNAGLIRKYFPQYAEQYDAIPFGVAKSDVARLVYMHALGGFYVDTDYKLLRPLDEQVRAVQCLVPLEGADPQGGKATPDYLGLGNAVLGSQPGYRFWSDLITYIFEERRPETLSHGDEIIPATGPEVVTRFYLARAADYPEMVLPPKNSFYPHIMRLGTHSSADAETYGVHLHWGSWRNSPPDIAARTLVRRKLNGLLS